MVIEIVGWIGSLLVLVTYILNIRKKITVDNEIFLSLNLLGGLLLAFYTFEHKAYANTVSNTVFILFTFNNLFNKNDK